jgi:hypothetical protein
MTRSYLYLLKAREGTALALGSIAALMVQGGASMADDPRKIAEARAACIGLAKSYAEKENQKDLILGDTSNVNSDWTDNVFEFKWSQTVQPEQVYCRGDANGRVITHLFVRGTSLACNHASNDPRLTSPCAIKY